MNWLSRLVVVPFLALALVGSGCSSDVKIGAVISQSGALASYGEKVKKGIDLALDEVRASGEAENVELIYKDDATNPDRGRQVTEELIQQDKVRTIIGAVGSPVTLAIAPICEENRVVLLSPSSSVPEISETGDYIYRNWPSDILEGTAMAKFARDLGLEHVAIFAQDDQFGAGLRDVFTQQYEGRFREIVKVVDFSDERLEELPALVAQVAELKPDGIYMVSYEGGQIALLQAIADAKLKAVLMGASTVTTDLVAHNAAIAERLVFPQPNFDVESHDPVVSAFVSAFRAKYDETPDIYAAHGYDAMKLLFEAIRLGGSAHPQDIKLGLSSIKDYKGAAGLTVFNAKGDVVRYPRIFIVQQGSAVPYDKFVDEGGSLLAGR